MAFVRFFLLTILTVLPVLAQAVPCIMTQGQKVAAPCPEHIQSSSCDDMSVASCLDEDAITAQSLDTQSQIKLALLPTLPLLEQDILLASTGYIGATSSIRSPPLTPLQTSQRLRL